MCHRRRNCSNRKRSGNFGVGAGTAVGAAAVGIGFASIEHAVIVRKAHGKQFARTLRGCSRNFPRTSGRWCRGHSRVRHSRRQFRSRFFLRPHRMVRRKIRPHCRIQWSSRGFPCTAFPLRMGCMPVRRSRCRFRPRCALHPCTMRVECKFYFRRKFAMCNRCFQGNFCHCCRACIRDRRSRCRFRFHCVCRRCRRFDDLIFRKTGAVKCAARTETGKQAKNQNLDVFPHTRTRCPEKETAVSSNVTIIVGSQFFARVACLYCVSWQSSDLLISCFGLQTVSGCAPSDSRRRIRH